MRRCPSASSSGSASLPVGRGDDVHRRQHRRFRHGVAGPGAHRYCPGSNNTRGQMAVFIVKTFNLP